MATSLEEEIVACVEADMAAIGAPGAGVAVIDGGEMIFNRGFGFKRNGQLARVDAGTRFRIGSITKMLTAAAVMQQVEAGLLDLEDPVTRWVPELELSGRWSADLITVRHLLTHTAALPDSFEDAMGPQGDEALGDWAGGLGEVRLHARPGTFWNYANPNFALAGLVAERAAGLFYRDLMADRVFAAAGMSSTTVDPADVVASGNYSYGHHPLPSGAVETYAPDDYDSWVAAPAGFAFSTAEDLAWWALTLMDGGGEALSFDSAAAMQERQVFLDYTPEFHYGYGIFAERYKGLDVRQHGGNVIGWGAWLLWVPEARFAVSVLGNTAGSLSAAAYCIVDAVLEPEEEDPHYPSDPELWDAFTGAYSLTNNVGRSFRGEVTRGLNTLSIILTDPEDPVFSYRSLLQPLFLSSFAFDGDGDGAADFDLTFIDRPSVTSPEMWLRGRYLVGPRLRSPRFPTGRASPDSRLPQ